jgi:Ca2+-binding EF-hand superfamily protein
MGIAMEDEDVFHLYYELDKDGDGLISFAEVSARVGRITRAVDP